MGKGETAGYQHFHFFPTKDRFFISHSNQGLFGKHFIYVTHLEKRGLEGIAKSIDPGQPAQSAQADHGRNFSLLADFLCIN